MSPPGGGGTYIWTFHQQYPYSCMEYGCDPIRIPTYAVSREVANISVKLEHLSALLMVGCQLFLLCLRTFLEVA